MGAFYMQVVLKVVIDGYEMVLKGRGIGKTHKIHTQHTHGDEYIYILIVQFVSWEPGGGMSTIVWGIGIMCGGEGRGESWG